VVEVLVAPSQTRLAAALQHRFFLRLHMTAILTGTLLVGLLVTQILFILHLNIFAIRYALAVIAAYAAFVGFVKLWILYIAWCGMRRGRDDWFDCLNFSGSGTSSPTASSSSFSGAGGRFGGGGASGSWDEGGESSSKVAVAAVTPQRSTSSSSSSSKSSKSSKSSSGGGGGDDLGELILILLIIALALAIIASFAWLVWAAPAILSETAFNAALAGALTRHAHKATHGEWVGGVMRKTAIPFFLILALSIAMGWWAQHYCPAALRLTDALHCVK
jgi:hypothetical protein